MTLTPHTTCPTHAAPSLYPFMHLTQKPSPRPTTNLHVLYTHLILSHTHPTPYVLATSQTHHTLYTYLTYVNPKYITPPNPTSFQQLPYIHPHPASTLQPTYTTHHASPFPYIHHPSHRHPTPHTDQTQLINPSLHIQLTQNTLHPTPSLYPFSHLRHHTFSTTQT